MKKVLFFLIIGCKAIYSQDYAVSAIPENLQKNANAVVRLDKTEITINNISDIRYRVHQVKTIFNKSFSGFGTPVIYYEKGDNISDVKVVIYDASGKKMANFSKSDFKDFAGNSQGTFYSDNRVLAFEYTPIQYPYTIDFTYEYGTDNTVFIPDFEPVSAYNISLQEKSLFIDNKSGIKLKSKEYPSKLNFAKVESNGTENLKNYTLKNIPAMEEESMAPDLETLLPKVSFALEQFHLEGKKGSIASWKDFGSWYYNSLLQPVSVSTPQIKNEIASLNLQGSTEEKVKKIFQFMQSKTRYVFVALGIGGWQPMLPDEVQKKGYGDCKGLTNYMKMLLDEAGIKSYYSIINANSTSIKFDENFPKMGGNHVILMVPTEKGNIWLENTSQQIAFNHLGYQTTDRNVLCVKQDGIDIVETPVYTANQNHESQILNLTLSEDKGIHGNGKFSYTGNQYDFNLGMASMDKKDREEKVRGTFRTVDFSHLNIQNVINDRDKAELKYDLDFKAGNFSKILGNSIMFRSVPLYSEFSLNKMEDRKLPFEISFAYQDEYEINYQFPANYQIDEMPENVMINSEFGNFILSYTKKDNALQVKRMLKINKGQHSNEKFNDYVAFRNKVMNADNAKILITKP